MNERLATRRGAGFALSGRMQAALERIVTEQDVIDLVECLRMNMKATTSIRIRNPDYGCKTGDDKDAPRDTRPHVYLQVADGTTQVRACQVFAQILRLMPTTDAQQSAIEPPPTVRRMSVEEKLAELRGVGLTLRDIVADIEREVGPEPAIATDAQVVETGDERQRLTSS